jgi:hypothetical protein
VDPVPDPLHFCTDSLVQIQTKNLPNKSLQCYSYYVVIVAVWCGLCARFVTV